MSKIRRIIGIIAIALMAVGLAAITANAVTHQDNGTANVCVRFGNGPTAAGNYMLWNWDRSPCPSNTYPHQFNPSVTQITGDDDSGLLANVLYTPAERNNGSMGPTDWEVIDGKNGTYECYFDSFANQTPPVDIPVGKTTPAIITCERFTVITPAGL